MTINRYPYRATHRVAVGVEETAENILGLSGRKTIYERHKNYLIAATWFAVPGTVLADEYASSKTLGQ